MFLDVKFIEKIITSKIHRIVRGEIQTVGSEPVLKSSISWVTWSTREKRASTRKPPISVVGDVNWSASLAPV